jgi:cold-inducible RNA-binding protein
MGKRVFVGNLSFNTSSDQLRAAFESCGTLVDVKIISDRETGRSRGFGFVEFSTDQQAAEAIEKLDGMNLDGRQLKVNEAQERVPSNDRRSGNMDRPGRRMGDRRS